MFWSIKFWMRDCWHAFVLKQWKKMYSSEHYQWAESWIQTQVQRGDANYLRALIDCYEEKISKNA